MKRRQDEGQRLTQVKGQLRIPQVAPNEVSQVPHCGERAASAEVTLLTLIAQGPAGNLETSAPGLSWQCRLSIHLVGRC